MLLWFEESSFFPFCCLLLNGDGGGGNDATGFFKLGVSIPRLINNGGQNLYSENFVGETAGPLTEEELP